VSRFEPDLGRHLSFLGHGPQRVAPAEADAADDRQAVEASQRGLGPLGVEPVGLDANGRAATGLDDPNVITKEMVDQLGEE
jgi:hypothetical protein